MNFEVWSSELMFEQDFLRKLNEIEWEQRDINNSLQVK